MYPRIPWELITDPPESVNHTLGITGLAHAGNRTTIPRKSNPYYTSYIILALVVYFLQPDRQWKRARESSDATKMSESGSQLNRSSNSFKIPNLSLQYVSLIHPSSLCSLSSATLSRILNKTLQYGLVFCTRPYHSTIQSSSDANSPYPPVLSSSLYLQL